MTSTDPAPCAAPAVIAQAPAGGVWVLRHGESVANVAGLIVSVPGPRALEEVGLTSLGREQARAAGARALGHGFGPDTRVVTSDFARARQTAEEFAAVLGAAAPTIDERLRERSFGAHDEGPATAYEIVWARDRDRTPQTHEVEEVGGVAARVLAALRDADALAAGRGSVDGLAAVASAGAEGAADARPVVLVAHGDVLQIALALGEGRDPHEHREVPHLGNAELRRLGSGRGAPPVGRTAAQSGAPAGHGTTPQP